MLRLTKLTDYGILLMTHIAASEDALHTAADLSEAARVPLPTVSKILQMLLHEGLLDSVRGARGGYHLARSAKDISVQDVINTFEGSIALTECNLDGCECDQLPNCTTSGNWQRINGAIRQVMQTITLADMSSPDFAPVFRMERTIPLREAHG